MILTALANYYEQLLREHPDEVPEQGWSRVKISHLLVISEAGELVDIIPAPDKNGWMKRVPKYTQHTVAVETENLLADKADYLLGLKPGDSERGVDCFEEAKKLHLSVLEKVQSPAGLALRNFFETWNPSAAAEHPAIVKAGIGDLAGSNILLFNVDGYDITEDLEVVSACLDHNRDCASGAAHGRCLVTGEYAPIQLKHDSIKLLGTKATSPLVSFNERSFESYGHYKEQGLNAPVGEEAAFAYTTALNHLLASPSHRVRIGDTTVVYWAEHGDAANSAVMSLLLGARTEDLSFAFVDETADASIAAVWDALARGKAPNIAGLDSQATFHVLGIAPKAARISVRFYERDSFGSMLENVMRHYRRMAIVHAPWQQDFLSPYRIVRAAENPSSKNPVVASELGGALLRSILTDTRYPESLYSNIMLRLRATQGDKDAHAEKVSYERAAFIKAYLIKNASIYEEGTMETIDAERDEAAYVLGRLFWVLEDIQHAANPELNATISDKYFDRACTTPALVFPTLVALSKKHLRKIQGKTSGLAYNLETRLGGLLAGIEAFPKSLSNTAQGDFILGYYHQKTADIHERAEKKREREAAESAALSE